LRGGRRGGKMEKEGGRVALRGEGGWAGGGVGVEGQRGCCTEDCKVSRGRRFRRIIGRERGWGWKVDRCVGGEERERGFVRN